jgi:hypothetical protein
MTHVGYVTAGWGTTLVVLAAYSWRTLRRGRRLASLVPEVERRWANPPHPKEIT